MHLTVAKGLLLTSAALGAGGAAMLIRTRIAADPFPWSNAPRMAEEAAAQNRRRSAVHRIGLILIMAGFVLQGVAILLSS